MLINQAAVSAVLVLVFASNGSVASNALRRAGRRWWAGYRAQYSAFPPDPVVMLCSARADVRCARHPRRAGEHGERSRPDWPMAAADRLHQQLNGLTEVLLTLPWWRRAPCRWGCAVTVRDPINRPSTWPCWSSVASGSHHCRGLVAISRQRPRRAHRPAAEPASGEPGRQRIEHAAAAQQPRRHCTAACGSNAVRRYRPSVRSITTGNRTPGPVGHVSLNWRETPAPAASAPASARPAINSSRSRTRSRQPGPAPRWIAVEMRGGEVHARPVGNKANFKFRLTLDTDDVADGGSGSALPGLRGRDGAAAVPRPAACGQHASRAVPAQVSAAAHPRYGRRRPR